MTMLIRDCTQEDLDAIFEVVNDAARAYRGVIPADRWHEPYMTMEELRREVAEGVRFYAAAGEDGIAGVMGIQDKGEVSLIRHAYVRTQARRAGIGGVLLGHLESLSSKPLLIGTWRDAFWAIRFYLKNGYRLLPEEEKDRLLRRFWNIPERQVETSVVLASRAWSGEGESGPPRIQRS